MLSPLTCPASSDSLVATVKRGERDQVVQRKGSWTAIVIGEGADRKEGWVLSDKLRVIEFDSELNLLNLGGLTTVAEKLGSGQAIQADK